MKLELGKVVGIWGVKGWIKLHSYTRNRADISQYSQWLLQPAGNAAGANKSYAVTNCRPQGKSIVAKLVDIDTADAALALNGCRIFVEADDLPELPKDEYYWHQLVGLRVSNTTGCELGVVESIIETGANDVMVVKPDKADSETEVLIPYSNDVVTAVDLKANTLQVDWDLSYLE